MRRFSPSRLAARVLLPAAACLVACGAAGAAEKVMLGDASLTAGVPGTGPITVEQIDRWLADPKNSAVLEPVLPLGLSQGAGQVSGLDKNPLTRAKIELGRQLYFDPRLSADATVSCASCHAPAPSSGTAVPTPSRPRRSARSPTPSRWASRTRGWSSG